METDGGLLTIAFVRKGGTIVAIEFGVYGGVGNAGAVEPVRVAVAASLREKLALLVDETGESSEEVGDREKTAAS